MLFNGSVDANGTKILTQITYLLYLRFISNFSENVIDNERIPGIEQDSIFETIRWDIFSKADPDTQYKLYRDYVLMFLEKNMFSSNIIREYPHDFENLIDNPEMLAKAVRLINESYELATACGWDNIKANGEVYDYLLDECSASYKQAIGRTPRHIANFMCNLTKPSINDRIVDLFCDNGNILVSAINHILRTGYIAPQLTKDQDGMDTLDDILNVVEGDDYLRDVINGLLYGYDINEMSVFFCAMNMQFHGIARPQIKKMDALSESFDYVANSGSYNIVLVNPPFGQYTPHDNPSQLISEYPAKRIELLYLHRTIDLLSEGGRAAIILPEGTLFSGDKSSVAARKRLLEECKINAVFSLPAGVFRPSSSLKTSIIVLSRTWSGQGEPIWFYELDSDGYSLDNRRRKQTENPLPEAIRWFNDRNGNEKAFSVDVHEIIENNYNLSCGNYKVYEDMAEPMEQPQSILNDILKKENDLMKELGQIESMIR